MIDITKLSGKTIMGLAVIAAVVIVATFGLSYFGNQPFTINGKEYGFGSKELQKRTADLESCRSESSKAIDQLRQSLADSTAENSHLKEVNATLVSQQQERAQRDAAMWFPIDDIEFYADGTFSTLAGKQGQGKWSSKDSAITLQFVGMSDSEIVIETNLPPPGNKIRIRSGGGVSVPMDKWDYHLFAKEVYASAGRATIRVERRPKSQGM